jgi:hypothetical protein
MTAFLLEILWFIQRWQRRDSRGSRRGWYVSFVVGRRLACNALPNSEAETHVKTEIVPPIKHRV